jgi:hypothetical protein
MKIVTRTLLLILTLTVGLSAASLAAKRVSIGDIESNPARYFDKKVTISGTVETSYGVTLPSILISRGSGGMYKIDDGTGEIWVVTERGVPAKGARLKLKGKIQTGVNINGRTYGLVLYEDKRSFEKR